MRKIAAFTLVLISISGCATTKENFYKNPSQSDKTSLCRAYLKANDPKFRHDIGLELDKRGIYSIECKSIVDKQDAAIAVGLAVAVVGAAAIACANSSNGCGGGRYQQAADWDEFFNQYGQLVWACREIYTGRFTYASNCYGQPQIDDRWPSKYAA